MIDFSQHSRLDSPATGVTVGARTDRLRDDVHALALKSVVAAGDDHDSVQLDRHFVEGFLAGLVPVLDAMDRLPRSMPLDLVGVA